MSILKEIVHFLSVTPCESLPLTRLEGLKELTRQLHDNKGQIRELLKECVGMMSEQCKMVLCMVCYVILSYVHKNTC